MKTCKTCKVEKEYSEFPKEPRMKDGYRSDCLECRKAYHRANSKHHYARTRTDKLAKVKAYNQIHRAEKIQYLKDYRQRPGFAEKAKEYSKNYRENPVNKANRIKYAMRYYLEKKAAPGITTKADLVLIWEAYEGKCWICDGVATETDHYRPLSKGGSNWPDNLRPCCKRCNIRKGNKWPFKPSDIQH